MKKSMVQQDKKARELRLQKALQEEKAGNRRLYEELVRQEWKRLTGL